MEQVSTIGLDIAKHVFQVHGADAAEHALRSSQGRRAAGERHRVPGPRSPGASAHPVRQRSSRAPDGIRLRLSEGDYPR